MIQGPEKFYRRRFLEFQAWDKAVYTTVEHADGIKVLTSSPGNRKERTRLRCPFNIPCKGTPQ